MYEILIEKNAEKELSSINSPFFENIRDAILNLAENPRPNGCRKLKGFEKHWRIRVGVYRIIYEIDDKVLELKIERIRHRSSVYN